MTVFTPECVERMVAKGAFRKVFYKDLPTTDCEEVFFFRYPSPNMVNECNGDGDWMEVWDWNDSDFSDIETERGTIPLPARGHTALYVR